MTASLPAGQTVLLLDGSGWWCLHTLPSRRPLPLKVQYQGRAVDFYDSQLEDRDGHPVLEAHDWLLQTIPPTPPQQLWKPPPTPTFYPAGSPFKPPAPPIAFTLTCSHCGAQIPHVAGPGLPKLPFGWSTRANGDVVCGGCSRVQRHQAKDALFALIQRMRLDDEALAHVRLIAQADDLDQLELEPRWAEWIAAVLTELIERRKADDAPRSEVSFKDVLR